MIKRAVLFVLAAILCLLPAADSLAAEETQRETARDLRENSWRYRNGEPIEIEEESISEIVSFAEDPWIWGIDVSEHQGEIDWEKVKAAGIGFAIIRCGYGEDYGFQDDLYWLRNVSECERLGIPYGVYLYSYALDPVSAYSEAQHVLRLINGRSFSHPVYYDMEENSQLSVDRAELASVFCNAIEAAGYRAGVYANLNWWENYLTDPCFEQWERWVAQWNVTCDYEGEYGLWQHTSHGQVDGIQGNVDMNYLIKEEAGGEDPGTEIPFKDVDLSAWYQPYVREMVRTGLMTGMTESCFGIGTAVLRAHFATILYRMAGAPPVKYAATFPDVPEDSFYTFPVIWGYYSRVHIIEGYGNGYFGPADLLTREQIVLILYRYAGKPGEGTLTDDVLSRFPDADKVTPSAKEAVKWAVKEGLIEGDRGNLNPQGSAMREQCAAVLTRYLRWESK